MNTNDNIILLDVDGCMIFHNQKIMDHLNLKFGTDYKYEDITDFAYPNVTDPEHKAEIYRTWSTDVYTGQEPVEGCFEALTRMRKHSRVLALSAPMDDPRHIVGKWTWLRNVLGFKREEIIITSAKGLVFGHMFVDDNPKNLIEWQNAWYQQAVVFDKPWNHHYQDPYVLRATEWEQIANLAEAR